jgi:hypothetical protein
MSAVLSLRGRGKSFIAPIARILSAELVKTWHGALQEILDPYRPELHYMGIPARSGRPSIGTTRQYDRVKPRSLIMIKWGNAFVLISSGLVR